jgi:hypothetical protein
MPGRSTEESTKMKVKRCQQKAVNGEEWASVIKQAKLS